MASRNSSAPRRGPATVDLVLCSVRQGRLHVLVTKSADGKAILPHAWMRVGVPLEDTARGLVRDVAGITVSWLVAGAAVATRRHPVEAALSVPFVGVAHALMPAPDGSTWCPVDALPALAPRHRQMAEEALATLRLHMDAAPVAFRLLPATFTLSELQQVYELLVGRRLHKASFRRALQGAWLVEPTDEWRSEGRGRPAQLYRFAPRKRRGAPRAVRFDLLGH